MICERCGQTGTFMNSYTLYKVGGELKRFDYTRKVCNKCMYKRHKEKQFSLVIQKLNP